MILITGGAGFIGSVLASELNKIGHHDLIIVDRLRSGPKWFNLRKLKFSQFINADEFLFGDYDALFKKVECVFHLGACSSTTETDVDYLMKNNVDYSQEMFALARKLKVPFIYASSAATYGLGEHGYSDDHKMIDSLSPLNPYGFSKQVFDRWVLAQKSRPDIWFGLKFFNVYGPNEYHKGMMRSMVQKAYEQIKKEGVARLFKSNTPKFADGGQLRDFIYVKDAVQVMILMMQKKLKAKSGIYNLGTGQARSFNDLVKATFLAMDIPSRIEYIAMPDEIAGQYQNYTQAETKKLHTLLPKFQFTSLEDGVRDYVQNYLMNDNRYH